MSRAQRTAQAASPSIPDGPQALLGALKDRRLTFDVLRRHLGVARSNPNRLCSPAHVYRVIGTQVASMPIDFTEDRKVLAKLLGIDFAALCAHMGSHWPTQPAATGSAS